MLLTYCLRSEVVDLGHTSCLLAAKHLQRLLHGPEFDVGSKRHI